MLWIENQNQSNVSLDNLNNVKREASRHFRNKKTEYLKAKIDEPETNSTNKIRDCVAAPKILRKVISLGII